MTFLDKESDDYYYIHYVNGKMDEAYVGGPYYVVREGYDELYEEYASLEGLSKTAENEEIEDLCSISAEDFKRVRTRYQDSLANDILARVSTPNQSEPVNRIGRGVAYVLVALVFVILLVGVSILPFMQVDGGTYIGIFIIFCLVLLIAGLSSFSPKTWLERRIKWLTGSVKQEVLDFGTGKAKWYYANKERIDTDHEGQFVLLYQTDVAGYFSSWDKAELFAVKNKYVEGDYIIHKCDLNEQPIKCLNYEVYSVY